MAYSRPTGQNLFGKPKGYGPPKRMDVSYKGTPTYDLAFERAYRRKSVFYSSDWKKTQRFIASNPKLNTLLKREAMAYKSAVERQIRNSGGGAELAKELKMTKMNNKNFSEERPAYLVYIDRGRLSAADYKRRHGDDGKKSWFVEALEKRSGGKKIKESTW